MQFYVTCFNKKMIRIDFSRVYFVQYLCCFFKFILLRGKPALRFAWRLETDMGLSGRI